MSRKFKPFEDLTIQDNFMFVKVFSNPETAKPFLEAVLKIKIQKISVVGEYHLDANPQKKRVRFDIFAKEDVGDAVGRTFDIEMQVVDTGELPLRARYYQSICDVETLGTSRRYKELKEQYVIFLCPKDVFGKGRAIYEFENIEKNDHSIPLGDLTYKIFCIFNKYREFTDKAVREYMEYFATSKVDSQTARNLQDQVDFYRRDVKTRSDYMDLEYLLSEERREGRAEGLAEGEQARQAQAERIAELEAKLAKAEAAGFVSDTQAEYKP